MSDDQRKQEIDVLLEEYRAVSQELTIYVQEMLRCFIYAAVLAAGYVGIGIVNKEESAQLTIYVPYAFIVLVFYFLAISTIRVNLTIQRAAVESTINELLGERRLTWDSTYAAAVQSHGFVVFGRKWYQRLPTPLLLLGFVLTAAAIAVFTVGVTGPSKTVITGLLLSCGLLAVYVFLAYPPLARHARRAKD